MINKITEEDINNIESNSVLALPNDPTGAGYKAERIKHAFIDPITGKTGSIVSVINRIIEDINGEPGSVTISNSEPTEKVIGDVWVNFNGEVKVYNGSAWEKKLDIVTSDELEMQVSNINSALNNKASIQNIVDINNKIPAEASTNNKLADKAFVNSSVATATATFQGTYTNIADLPTEGVDINDYAFVSGVEDGNAYYDRYKYTGSEWKKEYRLNNSSFTAEQWAAINSGITNGKISDINNLISGLSFSKADKDSVYTKNETLNEINEKVSQRLDALGAEQVVNKTTAVSADSTDTQYPSAKAVYTLTNAIEKKVDKNTKDINSLKAIVSNTVVTDTEVSDKYYTRKTADSLSIVDGAQTSVNKISGNTISSKNLIPTPTWTNGTTTANGVTFTVNTNGSITAKGTTNSSNSGVKIVTKLLLPAGTYTVSGYSKSFWIVVKKYTSDTATASWIDSTSSRPTSTGTLTEPTYVRVEFYININGLAVNDTIYPMLNKGNTALPYYQYFSGLKNAGFKSILSTGKNLIPYPNAADPYVTFHGVTFKTNSDGSVQVNGTPDGTGSITYSLVTKTQKLILPAGTYTISGVNTSELSLNARKVKIDGTDVSWIDAGGSYSTGTLTEPTQVIIQLYIAKAVTATFNTTIYPIIAFDTNTAYESYKSDGIACESTLDLAEFDYVVPSENKVYRQSETITFDGTESGWQVDDAHGYSNLFRFVGYASDKIPFNDSSSINAISNKYQSVTRANTWADYDSFVVTSYLSKITIKDTSVSTLEEFKAKLVAWASEGKPLTVTYKKTTVTTENVSFDKADYTAYLNGSESVMQGDNNTGDYGVECTVDQNFYVKNEV